MAQTVIRCACTHFFLEFLQIQNPVHEFLLCMLNPVKWFQIRTVECRPVFILTEFRPFLEFPDDGLHDTVHSIEPCASTLG